MKKLAFGIVICLGFAAVASAQDKAKGEKAYTDNKCAMCHSIGDKGNKKGPLDKVGGKYSKDELTQWITDAKGMATKAKATRTPAMKNYTLPAGDVADLVAYLQTLK